MATEIFIPKMGAGIEEVKIGKVYKKVGEKVSKGDVIFEIITDKATFDVEAEEGGIIKKINCKEGEYRKVLDVVGSIG